MLKRIAIILVMLPLLAICVFADQMGVKSETFVDFWTLSGNMFFSVGTSGDAGTLDTLYFWVDNMSDDTLYTKAALYNHEDNTFIDSTVWKLVEQTEDVAWIGLAFVAGASIDATTNYRMTVWWKDSPGNTTGAHARDIDAGYGFHYFWATGADRLGTPWPSTTDTTNFTRNTTQHAIYVIYTGAAGAVLKLGAVKPGAVRLGGD